MAPSWWSPCCWFLTASTAASAACSPWRARAGPGQRAITRGWSIGTIPRGASTQTNERKEVRLNIQINQMTTAMSRIAIGCAVALLAACGQSTSTANTASAPGITASEIKIGSTQPLTGPAAPGYSEIAPASNAYFKYVNAHGGVFGRKITYVYKDDSYNPTQTVAVTKKLVLQNKVFAIVGGLGTPTHTKVVGYLNASKVPDLFVSSGCPCWDNGSSQPWTFGWQTQYTIEGKILGQYIKQHLAGKKVGVF